jgi:hypothetical protein
MEHEAGERRAVRSAWLSLGGVSFSVMDGTGVRH